MKNAKQSIRKAVQETSEMIGKKKGEGFIAAAGKPTQRANSIKDILGVTDENAESVYGQAYILYNSGRYNDAGEVFRLLIMLNAIEPKYTMGLAACYHMLKEYSAAAAMYNLVTIIDPTTPLPFFHASDCYLQLGDKISAAIMLEMAIKRAANRAEYATLLQRATITLEALKKELSKGPKTAST